MLFFIFEVRKTIKPEKKERCKEEKLKEVHKGRPCYNFYVTPLVTLIAFEACVKMCFSIFTYEIVNVWSLKFFLMPASSVTRQLTHYSGRVTQICVFTLQLCRTGDAGLRF